tara:strand:+ start:4502 stop:5527 length:1026 start_codon:yes stop_codon:yes gene_type:complete
MRYALSGSALVHVGIFGAALIGFVWPQPDDAPAPGAVTIDIVTMDTVSSNQNATLQTSSSENLVSSGSVAQEGAMIDPVETLTLQPVPQDQPPLAPEVAEAPPRTETPTETLAPSQAVTPTPVEPIEAEPVAAAITPILAAAPDQVVSENLVALAPSTVQPAETAAVPVEIAQTIEPVSVADFNAAPVPHTLSFERPSRPTQRPRAEQPRPPTQAARQAGNGGANNADAAASKATSGQQGAVGGGGTADIARWEQQVRRAVANARRTPRAARGVTGEVLVSFTVSAGGSLSGVQIIASSGHPVLDQAARDTVTRAAPFPPIPAGLGMASRTVKLPLGFVRN